MAAAGFSARSELRKTRRKAFHLSAKIYAKGAKAPRECTVENISETGAKLVAVSDGEPLPDEFMLLLTGDGRLRRRCRVVWRDGLAVGVQFFRSHAAESTGRSQSA
jgi:hypothetical protein